MTRPFRLALAALALLLRVAPAGAQPPDPRLKVDVLLVVAHPDDEGAVSAYLARLVHDEGKRVAVIYATRGDGGGNAVGPEQAMALGAVREVEARRALATLGIDLAWFLDGRDTPSQDPLQSLARWQHGPALEQAVRLVRLTRPEVVLTWMPAMVIGENHGDHQAAGVLATEAFDLAGRADAFPSQVAPARDRRGDGNLTEGLVAWQPKKLYFVTDRRDVAALRAHGPTYPSADRSPSARVPYYQFTARAVAPHLTQFGAGNAAVQAVASGDYTAYAAAQRAYRGTMDTQLVLGASLVGGHATGDTFEGIAASPVAARALAPAPPPAPRAPAVALGGPWRFYRAFRAAHALEHLDAVVPPELGLKPGAVIALPVVLHGGAAGGAFTLDVRAPAGWQAVAPEPVTLGAGESADVVVRLTAPAAPAEAAPLELALRAGGTVVATTRLALQALATMPW